MSENIKQQKNDATPDSEVTFRRDESEGQRTESRDEDANSVQSRPENPVLEQNKNNDGSTND